MSTVIRLDTNALNALFPEGSEARIELQRAVVAQFVQANIRGKTIGAEVEKIVGNAKDQAVRDALKELGVTPGWGGSGVTLSDSFKRQLHDEARSATQFRVTEQINRAADEVAGRVLGRLQAAVDAKTDEEIGKLLRTRLERISKAL